METKLHDAVYWTLPCAKARARHREREGTSQVPPPGLAALGVHRLVAEGVALERWGWPAAGSPL